MQPHPMQATLDHIVETERAARFKDSPQITLGELIRLMEAIPPTYESGGQTHDKHVWFDFANTYPSTVQSWRGSYRELAITFDYDGQLTSPYRADHSWSNSMTVERFLTMLREAVGATFQGYKGGDYTMSERTPVWVANWGDSGNTGVVGVRDLGWSVVIDTAWCEY